MRNPLSSYRKEGHGFTILQISLISGSFNSQYLLHLLQHSIYYSAILLEMYKEHLSSYKYIVGKGEHILIAFFQIIVTFLPEITSNVFCYIKILVCLTLCIHILPLHNLIISRIGLSENIGSLSFQTFHMLMYFNIQYPSHIC